MSLRIKEPSFGLISILYLIFFPGLPLIYSGKLIDPVLIPRQLFLTVFLLVIGILILVEILNKKKTPDFGFIKLALPCVFFVLILFILVSFLQSNTLSESYYKFSKTLLEFLFYILTTYLIIQDKLKTEFFIKSIMVFAAIIMGMACYQLFSLHNTEGGIFKNLEGITSSIGNKNLLSSILFLTFPFLVNGLLLNKPWKFFSSGLILLMTLLLWLIQTKAVLIACVIFFALFLLIFFKRKTGPFNNKLIKLFFITGGFLLILIGLITINNKEQFVNIFSKVSISGRLEIWENSILMLRENFIWGTGAGNWQIHFPKYGLEKLWHNDLKMGLVTFQRPHNDFLWIFCELGIGGVVTYLFIFLISFYYLFKLIKMSKELESIWLYSSLMATIAGYMFIAFVDFPLERVEHQVLLCLIFSIVTAHYYKTIFNQKASPQYSIGGLVLSVMIFSPIIYSFLICGKRYVGEFHTQKLLIQHRQANWNGMIRESDKAKNDYFLLDPMSMPIDWYKGVALFSMGEIQKANHCFEQANLIHPYNIHVLNNLASSYESMNNHIEAEKLYLKAISISPGFEEALLNLSAVYFNNKNYIRAFETIGRCSTNSTDPKYALFLPPILESRINELIRGQKDELKIKYLLEFKDSREKTRELYIQTQDNKLDFCNELLKKADLFMNNLNGSLQN